MSSDFSSPGGEGESHGEVVGLAAGFAVQSEFGEFASEGFDVTAAGGDFEFIAFRHDLDLGDENAAGDVARGGGLAGGDHDGDEGALDFFTNGFDDGNSSARFVDDEDARGDFAEFLGHILEARYYLRVGRAQRDAFGLADDIAAMEVFTAEHVGVAGWFIEAFEDDDGGVAAALAEVDADEEDAVDWWRG